MLEVKNLHKSFGENEVLKGIDFSVKKGEVVAILGSSGSGKTTLLRCISFLERADSGTISLDGFEKDMTELTRREVRMLRMKMGFVFQEYNLFRNKTAFQNVTEGLRIAQKIPADKARETAVNVLKKVGMLERADYYPDELSGGQKQRVAIARAIALSPKVILFDEPTSALDPELTGEVLEVMKMLASEGTTMAVVTHEMGFARDVASRVVFMDGGKITDNRAPAEFFSSPESDAARRFLRRMTSDRGI